MNSQFSVGDYIVDSDSIYIITKIDQGRIFYSPANTEGHHPSVTGSIPLDNLVSSGFRPLCAKTEIDQFFKELSQAKTGEIIDSKLHKDLRCLNEPTKLIPLLKQLWTNKNNPDLNFSGSNRDTLEKIVDHLSREFALSLKQDPDKIRKKITDTLLKK
jgi:RNA polymerase-interacting CarD/CdnL/TRCF family regulator